MCLDQMPLLLDLSDPAPGALLIHASNRGDATRLLRSFLGSLSLSNSPRQVVYYILTADEWAFSRLATGSNCLKVVSVYDREAGDLVIELAQLAEQRKSGRRLGPATVLAIDGLESLLSYEEYNVNVHLRWLLEHGAKSHVWTIATLQNSALRRVERRMLQLFGTVISSANLVQDRLLNDGSSESIPLQPGLFSTRLGSDLVQFWAPDSG